MRALEELRAKGYHDLTVYTPVPVARDRGRDRARPAGEPRCGSSRCSAALTGTASGFFLTDLDVAASGSSDGAASRRWPAGIPPFVIITFELTILFGGLATLIGMVILGRLPQLQAVADLRSALHRRPLRRGRALPARARRPRCARSSARAGRRGGRGAMKYVFILVLLVVGGRRALLGGAVGFRWVDNMTADRARSCRASASSRCRAGVRARAAASSIIPKEQREVAAKQPNPVKATRGLAWRSASEHYVTFCTPCHGAEAKGGRPGRWRPSSSRRRT